MTDESQNETRPPIVPMLWSDFLSVIVLGGMIGLLVWGAGMLLNRFVFDVYFCQGDVTTQCASAKNYAAATASLVGVAVGLVVLIRLRVYRPLLVLLAAFISLWGVVQLSWNFEWYQGALVALVLYALAFGAYSWIARIRQFWIAFAVTTAVLIAIRLAWAL